MSKNEQTHFKNLAASTARFLKCVWPFWDIMHQRVNSFQLYLLLHNSDLDICGDPGHTPDGITG